MNSFDFIIAAIAGGLGFGFMVVGYAIGFKQGRREGYTAGRAVSRREMRV